jgi:penicillin-binding protein-related factor A (putative recombinase)
MIHQQNGIAFRGRALEDEIQATSAVYKLKGIAKVYKFPIPTRNAGGRIFYAEKTGFDFVGHWFKSGKAIYMEAKDGRTKKTLPLLRHGAMKKEFGVYAHQLTELYDNEQQGCEAFVIWRVHGQVFRLSPRDLIEVVKIGNEVVPEIHKNIMTKLNVNAGLIDFLNVLK